VAVERARSAVEARDMMQMHASLCVSQHRQFLIGR
jgi:hypothetical protein